MNIGKWEMSKFGLWLKVEMKIVSVCTILYIRNLYIVLYAYTAVTDMNIQKLVSYFLFTGIMLMLSSCDIGSPFEHCNYDHVIR